MIERGLESLTDVANFAFDLVDLDFEKHVSVNLDFGNGVLVDLVFGNHVSVHPESRSDVLAI